MGTKYDLFKELTNEYKIDITKIARRYAKKMGNVALIYCSSKEMINIKNIFKLIIAKLFNIDPKIQQQNNELIGPLIDYTNIFYVIKSKHRKYAVNGYVRLLENKYKMYNKVPINDLSQIIMIYYA